MANYNHDSKTLIAFYGTFHKWLISKLTNNPQPTDKKDFTEINRMLTYCYTHYVSIRVVITSFYEMLTNYVVKDTNLRLTPYCVLWAYEELAKWYNIELELIE